MSPAQYTSSAMSLVDKWTEERKILQNHEEKEKNMQAQ